MKKVFNCNTELCVDIKTILRTDRRTKMGKVYVGFLTNDREDHYVFQEKMRYAGEKRNPHIFRGKYITVTQGADGTLRPYFRPMKADGNFSLERYALGVYNELCVALGGFVEELRVCLTLKNVE